MMQHRGKERGPAGQTSRRKEAGDQSRKKYDMTQLLNAEHERVVPESNPYGYYCFKQSHKYKGDRGFVFEGRTPFTYTPTQCVALHPAPSQHEGEPQHTAPPPPVTTSSDPGPTRMLILDAAVEVLRPAVPPLSSFEIVASGMEKVSV
jgi:hypothetical protein